MLSYPSANLADFYRQMGDLFGVDLRPHNRWRGFTDLRARWLAHLDATHMRPVLLIDEADSLLRNRKAAKQIHEHRVVNLLLTLIEQHPGVVLLASRPSQA